MNIEVVVVPNAKRNEIKEEHGHLRVYLSTQARKGKANKLLLDIIAKHFGVKRSYVRILRGEKSRKKLIEILEA